VRARDLLNAIWIGLVRVFFTLFLANFRELMGVYQSLHSRFLGEMIHKN
jgi:hypothetical protein